MSVLKDIVEKKHYRFIDGEGVTWQEGVRLSAESLVADGTVSPDYYKQIIACIEKYLPAGVSCTHPEGGMFLWVTLPEGIKGVDIQRAAIKKGLAVCAGDPFYEYERNVPHLRLNFSNGSDEVIDRGIHILGDVMHELLAR